MTPSGPRSGQGDRRDTCGHQDGGDDPHVTAHLNVLVVLAVRAEVDARRSGRGEEPDDPRDHEQDRGEPSAGLCGLRGRRVAEA